MTLPLKEPINWREAFLLLTLLLKKIKRRQKIILFFDELPWLASKRSGVLQALDYYWNTEWSMLSNVKLIVCGSAASWMLDNIVQAKGGLYNRLTYQMHLAPLSLSETHEYLSARGVRLNDLQMLDLYLVFGGIPYYLRHIPKGKSPVQIINQLCFAKNAPLFAEFDVLFASLFEHADQHMQLIRQIAKRRFGISRQQLLNAMFGPKILYRGKSHYTICLKHINEHGESIVPYHS